MTKAKNKAQQAVARALFEHRRPVGQPSDHLGRIICGCGEYWAPLHQAKEVAKEEQALAVLLSDEAMLAELVKRGRLKVEMTLGATA